MKYIVIAVSMVLLSSCITDGKKSNGQAETMTTTQKKRPTGALAEKLYSGYHQNPANQAQKDENLLIEYAVENNLDVEKTSSGLYYLIMKEGSGENLIMGQRCSAHYRGYTMDGKEFDNSIKRGKPLAFNVGQMVAGWNEALLFMNVGTKAMLLLPSHLAYGTRGFPGLIGPNTPLIFEMEVVSAP